MDEKFLRKKSFALPKVNPFIHDLQLSMKDKLQILVMSFTLAPIRLFLIFILLIFAWLIAFISTLGLDIDSKKPVRSWRRLPILLLQPIMRAVFFCMGVIWIEQKGLPASRKEAFIYVIAPHSTFYDAVPCAIIATTVVAKQDLISAPFIGTLLKTLQPVLVVRHDPESRKKTIQEIHRRASSQNEWPQIIVFPEGTCTNGKALITFKAGAFIPGVPVQPVLIRYPNYLDTFTWTMNGPGGLTLLWYSLCQFYIRFQVEFLPVYTPSDEEIDDPKLYAENVRFLMAQALNVPCTEHTFEDCRLMSQAKSKDLPMEAGLVEFSKLSKKLGIDINEMNEMLDEFALKSRSCKDGLMGIEEFAELLCLPITEPLKELFNLYDRDGSGKLDFREYVIGMSLLSHAAVTEKSIKIAFKVFDRNGDGTVTHDELDHVLKSVFGHDFETRNIYDKIDQENKGRITFDEFYAFVKKRPEYAKLFMTYADLEQDDMPQDKIHNITQRRASHALAGSSILSNVQYSNQGANAILKEKKDE
uniref:lysophosphatidylcholine acyltransferase 2-like isoform X2 n=1 Tax=Styela clava TaxID=7725 RepID=UPI00193AA23F|nr:lysophosphatidylcholine acyltransferase 2-like isoform X2 [Styela clava]